MAFDRSRLPDPLPYFEGEGLKLTGKGAWRAALCVFHDEKTPSLRLHTERGAFVCYGCGTKGGDILAFHMQRHGLDFVAAVKALGAWVESDKPTKHQQKPMPFTARDGLSVLKDEAVLAAVAACNLARGTDLTDADRSRLVQAAQRISFITEHTQ